MVRNNIKYKTMSILENGYGISLRFLLQFAVNTYSDKNVDDAVYKAISVILFKLEGQLIKRHPEYRMEGRLLLDKMNLDKGTVRIGDKDYFLNTNEFPTVDMNNPYELTMEEMFLMGRFRADFINSMALERHINFLYEKAAFIRFIMEIFCFMVVCHLTNKGCLMELLWIASRIQVVSILIIASQW